MARTCRALVAFLLSTGAAGAQDAPAEAPALTAVPLESFRLSGTPALGLLGSAASSVTRPNTPRDLIANLVSNAGSDGIVPEGFSLETAPYWLTSHRRLELREYHRPSFADRLRYFTAISVATSRERRKSDSLTADASAAIAIRTLLASGRPSAALVAVGDTMRAQQLSYIQSYRRWESAEAEASGLAAMRRRLAREEETLSTLVTRVLVGEQAQLRDSAMRVLGRRDSLRARVARAEEAATLAARLEGDLDRIETKLVALAKRFAGEEIEPDGFTLQIAAGTRSRFERGEWTRRRSDGIGAWITPMYRLGANGLELIGVARYLSNVSDYSGRDLFDAGARLGIDIGKGSLSAEHVWRSLHGSAQVFPAGDVEPSRNSSTRWAILFDYPLAGKVWAVASFGTDYRRPDGQRPAIATIGLNLGFGAIELLPSPRSLAEN